MSSKLFTAHQSGYDPRGNVVYICTDDQGTGFFVYKPRTGYKSARFKKIADKGLVAAFEAQIGCGHLATVPDEEVIIQNAAQK